MTVQRIGQLMLVLGSVITLAGCETPTASEEPGARAATRQAARSGTVDTEAPEVFKTKEKGLWDGRPSLGGIWVAHPNVKDPERVRVVNTANGKIIEAALFRVERNLPGPPLKVSSDAAAALGMLAGQPSELDVVVLRRVEKSAPAEPEPIEAEAIPEAVAPAAAAGAAIETKALEPSGATPAAAAAPATTASGALRPRAKPGTEGAVAVAQPVKKKKWWQKKAKAAPAAVEAPLAADATTGAVAATAPIDPAAAVQAPTSSLSLPYLQVGTFTQEANAKQAAEALVAAGLPAVAKATTSGGKSIWRVVVGPAASAAERNAYEKAAQKLGYKDAYPVGG